MKDVGAAPEENEPRTSYAEGGDALAGCKHPEHRDPEVMLKCNTLSVANARRATAARRAFSP